ncbi:MAG: hypothetical protein Ct9H300mP28_20880 [Pseudomonadota bacterium]|nr:MAG: hypothetical protein Ct9H300mP28_20880 [Pseudomonadota bacterium]
MLWYLIVKGVERDERTRQIEQELLARYEKDH